MRKYLIGFSPGVFLLILIFTYNLAFVESVTIKEYTKYDKTPSISPDYTNLIIPYNIASLNFLINEQALKYYVKIYSAKGDTIKIINGTPEITIPLDSWQKLLFKNKGKDLYFEIYCKDRNNNWKCFEKIKNSIASEKIDDFLVYRLIDPAHSFWRKMGIYQRNIQNFSQKPVIVNTLTDKNCMNCHSFRNNDPDYMLLHLRSGAASGTLIKNGQTLIKVNTKTKFNRAGAYPSWHPNGKIIAFSANNLIQVYHSTGECRDVIDMDSDLIIYNIKTNTVTSSSAISDPEYLETFPAWSPDGKYLYFCRTLKIESYFSDPENNEGLMYDKILYDLMRIEYNTENSTWGRLETVIPADNISLSITLPRISPDGQFLLFCASQYGSFPIYLKNTDIYLLNLNTNQYKRLNINSDDSDSYHSWSSNSRWFVFSSKRFDGVHSQLYFSYVDKKGNTYKPFVLPQKDPEFYNTYLKTFNVPELVITSIKTRPQELVKVAFGKPVSAKSDTILKSRKIVKDEKSEWQKAPQ